MWTPKARCKILVPRRAQIDAQQVNDSEDSGDEQEPQCGFSGLSENVVGRMYNVNLKEGT